MKINKIIIVATLALGLPSCFSQEKKTEESAKVSAKKEIKIDFNADSAYSYIAKQCEFGPRILESKAHDNCVDMVRILCRCRNAMWWIGKRRHAKQRISSLISIRQQRKESFCSPTGIHDLGQIKMAMRRREESLSTVPTTVRAVSVSFWRLHANIRKQI